MLRRSRFLGSTKFESTRKSYHSMSVEESVVIPPAAELAAIHEAAVLSTRKEENLLQNIENVRQLKRAFEVLDREPCRCCVDVELRRSSNRGQLVSKVYAQGYVVTEYQSGDIQVCLPSAK